MTKEKNIGKLLKSYSKEVTYIEPAFELFFEMKYGKKELEKLYRVSPGFFRITRISLLNDSILCLARLYKSSRGSERTLEKLFSLLIHYSKSYESEVKKSIENIVEKYKNEYEKIKGIDELLEWRDSILAHNDLKYFEDRPLISSSIDLKIEDIREKIEFVKRLLNEMSELILGQSICYANDDYVDIYKLLDYEMERNNA